MLSATPGVAFQSPVSLSGYYFGQVAIGDLNGDGRPDVFGGQGVGASNVLLNDGKGGYAPISQGFLSGLPTGPISAVVLGDLDSDSDLDAVLALRGGTVILLNDGTGHFTEAGQLLDSTYHGDIKLGDLNHDGSLDIVTAGYDNESNSVIWLNDGHGHFTEAQELNNSSANGMALGDMNGDGSLDIVLTNGGFHIWYNGGTGHFTPATTDFDTPSSDWQVHLGDLDRDSDLDVVVQDYVDGISKVFLNDGQGHFQLSQEINAMDVGLGDLNGDGSLDAYVVGDGVSPNNTDDSVYLNDGHGFLTSMGKLNDPNGSHAWVTLSDLNGDEKLDAFVIGTDMAILLNDSGSSSGTSSNSDGQVTLPSSGCSFELTKSGQDVVLRDHGGTELFRQSQQSLTQLVIHGSEADDTLTVNLANGNPLTAGGITFDGAGGDNHFVLTGGSAIEDTLGVTTNNAGQIKLDGLALKFLNVTTVEDQLIATNRAFRFGDSNNSVILSDNELPNDGISRLSLVGGATFDFAVPTATLVIHGGAGDDSIVLAGADSLMNRVVSVFGDDGNDSLTGSSLADLLDGGAGNDVLLGQGGDDTLVGGEGLDTLLGGAGRDSLSGGGGNDRLNGQGGADTISGGLGDDCLIGGDGIDLLAESGDVNFLLKQTTLTGIGVDRLTQFEKALLTGGDRANVLDASGSHLIVTLIGGGGNDLLKGGPRSDSLDGGAGADTLNGGAGNDTASGGTGNDLILGGLGNDSLLGGADDDTILGGAGGDTLLGEDGNDILIGGIGNDSLDGGLGSNSMAGGGGSGAKSTTLFHDVFVGPTFEINEALKILAKWLVGS